MTMTMTMTMTRTMARKVTGVDDTHPQSITKALSMMTLMMLTRTMMITALMVLTVTI